MIGSWSSKTRRSVRGFLGFSESELIVGHVGRFHPMKDHANFLYAATIVAERIPGSRFLLVGRDVSLDNPSLCGIVPPHLAHRFICMGERSDVYNLMQGCDVFCQSSWSEAFPNVLGEAMALGIPCVATDVGESARIVGKTGRIVAAKNSPALAEAITDFLSLPVSERIALGRAARRHVENRYDMSNLVVKYTNLYKKLVSEKE